MDGLITGWCWCIDQPTTRAVVEVIVNGSIVGTLTAAQKRDELVTMGIGDGYHSFSFICPVSQDPDDKDIVIEAREIASRITFGRIVHRKFLGLDGAQSRLLQEANDAIRHIHASINGVTFGAGRRTFADALMFLGLSIMEEARQRRKARTQRPVHTPQITNKGRQLVYSFNLPHVEAPEVTIIFPAHTSLLRTIYLVYRMRKYIKIRSAEIVVIDNSDNASNVLITQYVHNIQYVRNATRWHFLSVLNTAALAARGRRVCFLFEPEMICDDNIWRWSAGNCNKVFAGLLEAEGPLRMERHMLNTDARYDGTGGRRYVSMLRRTFYEIGGFDETFVADTGAALQDLVNKARVIETEVIVN